MIEDLFADFMQTNYSITPSQKSMEILASAGFRVMETPETQFTNLRDVESRIRGLDLDELVAKVFALALPYEHVLKQHNLIIIWSRWLGDSEYKLGNEVEEPKVERKLVTEALGHFLVARQAGDYTRATASKIGECYRKLDYFKDALPYLLESRQKGDKSKENASKIGECYFELRRYEEGIEEYELSIGLAKKEPFNASYMHRMDKLFEASFESLVRNHDAIGSPLYRGLLQRFKSFYDNFMQFWRANEQSKADFKLMLGPNYAAMDRIGAALRETS